MVYIHMFIKSCYTICFIIWNWAFFCMSSRIRCIDRTIEIKNTIHHSNIIMINFFVISNKEKTRQNAFLPWRFHLIFWTCNFWRFIFFFRNSIVFYFQIGIIFGHFFDRNIIEKNSHVSFLVEIMFSFSLDYSIFQECYSTRVEKLKEKVVISKCVSI